MDKFNNFHQSMQIASEQLRASFAPLLTCAREAQLKAIRPMTLPNSVRQAINDIQGHSLGLGKIAQDAARLNPPLGQIIHEQFGSGLAVRKEFIDSMEHLSATIQSLRIEPIN